MFSCSCFCLAWSTSGAASVDFGRSTNGTSARIKELIKDVQNKSTPTRHQLRALTSICRRSLLRRDFLSHTRGSLLRLARRSIPGLWLRLNFSDWRIRQDLGDIIDWFSGLGISQIHNPKVGRFAIKDNKHQKTRIQLMVI